MQGVVVVEDPMTRVSQGRREQVNVAFQGSGAKRDLPVGLLPGELEVGGSSMTKKKFGHLPVEVVAAN